MTSSGKLIDTAANGETLTSEKILDAAREQVRRFGEAKTNVVDIARALGTSHTTIYRHFRSKAEVFDAIIAEAMRDEEELARTFVDAKGTASERLEGFVLALHRRKLDRFSADPEMYQLYRRVVEERPDLVRDYAVRMTKLVAAILADGVKKNEYKIDDVDATAEVVRDAVTVYVHPAHVEAAAKAGHSIEPALLRMMNTLNVAFRFGAQTKKPKVPPAHRAAKRLRSNIAPRNLR
jgi:AcrR family transcriptional regulator